VVAVTETVVRTVIGDISPDTLGPTSIHEHVLADLSTWYTTRRAEAESFREVPVAIETLPDVRWNAFSFLDNLLLENTELAAAELGAFAAAGGSAIVDMTSRGLGGSPRDLPGISRQAEVHIVLGCGYYVHRSHPGEVCGASVDALEEAIEREVRDGVGGSGVLPGTIGEIGMSAPAEPCERRVLRAGARVAARHGMSLHIHTDGGGALALEHVADCAGEGLAPERVVCGHMDERLDPDYHRAILEAGANVAFDTFGSELAYSGLFHHPSDRERMSALAGLLDAGWAGQIVLGHDVCVKANLHRFGGYGYDHLIRRVAPALQEEYGISADTIERLLVDNPRRLLGCRPTNVRPAQTDGSSLGQRKDHP
jgi:phosphotriesterase-related protein